MKKLSSIGAVAFAVLIAGLAILGFTAPAQAYPDAQINLTVNRDTLYSGQKFEATASSDSTTCDWTLEWNGTVQQGQSSPHHDFKTSFTAPQVSQDTTIPLRGTCRYQAANGRGTATAERTVMITVRPARSEVSPPNSASANGPKSSVAGPSSSVAGPKSSASGSDLPNTGGPNMVFLLGGLVLLLAGATAVTVSRRKAEEAESQVARF